ncbi:MAG: hypothetical protein L3K15_01695 [Thermoplasmata archaeon]|nr:hypothetical protein [Thermoplasmata archaeon]
MARSVGRRASDPTALALAKLEFDRRHGATDLAVRALRVAGSGVRTLASLPDKESRAKVRSWGRTIAAAQPAMGAMVVAGVELQGLARSTPEGRLGAAVRTWSRVARNRIENELPAVVRTGRDYFPPQAEVVTLSRSATILRLLTSLRDPSVPRQVTVLRSEPGGEGVSASRAMSAAGLRARCVDDERVDEAVGPADLVVVGADSLLADGSIIHKVGTRRLAERARRWHVPVVVAVGLSKLVPWRERSSSALPALFDRTPPGLIGEYWTDRGRWRRPDVVAEARRRSADRGVVRPRS